MLLFVFLFLLSILGHISSRANSSIGIDEMYSELFHLSQNVPMVSEMDQIVRLNIEFALFHADIDRLFYSIDDTLLSDQKKSIIEENLKSLKKLSNLNDIDQQQQHLVVRNCEIWKFWREVSDTFEKNGLLPTHTKKEIQKREMVDTEKVNCSKIEKALKQNEEAKNMHKTVKNSCWVNIYLRDLEFCHFCAIKFLLTKTQINEENWTFSKLFAFHPLQNEPNFLFKLRILHIKNDKETLCRIKNGINELVGDPKMHLLEFEASVYFAPEINDHQTVAEKYMPIVANIDSSQVSIAAVNIAVRIYIERIWHLFLAFKKREKEAQNVNYWPIISKKLDTKCEDFFVKVHKKSHSLEFCHRFWLSLAKMHNELVALSEREKVPIKYDDLSRIEAIEGEIVEDHCHNMELLVRKGQNEFSEWMEKANDDGKLLLKEFIIDRIMAESFEEKFEIFNELIIQFPALKQKLQFDDASYSLVEQYQCVLMSDKFQTRDDLETFNTNVFYFLMRQMLQDSVKEMQMDINKWSTQNEQFVRNLAKLVSANGSGRFEDEAEKRKQICYIGSFLRWLNRMEQKRQQHDGTTKMENRSISLWNDREEQNENVYFREGANGVEARLF